MGDLKRWGRDIYKGVGDFAQWGIEGSKKLGRVLGYDKAFKGLAKPPPPGPPVAPMPDTEDLQRARRRRLGSMSRSGRASTILSDTTDDTLG